MALRCASRLRVSEGSSLAGRCSFVKATTVRQGVRRAFGGSGCHLCSIRLMTKISYSPSTNSKNGRLRSQPCCNTEECCNVTTSTYFRSVRLYACFSITDIHNCKPLKWRFLVSFPLGIDEFAVLLVYKMRSATARLTSPHTLILYARSILRKSNYFKNVYLQRIPYLRHARGRAGRRSRSCP